MLEVSRETLLSVLIWLAVCGPPVIATAQAAKRLGRSPLLWGLPAVFFSWFATLFLHLETSCEQEAE